MKIILSLLLNAGAVFLAAYLLPGVELESYWVAIIVAVVLGILNILLKPLLILLTLPINLLTLGLFTLVINTGLVLLTDQLVDGFTVLTFWWALAFSLVVSLISSFLNSLK